jgi:hypothetical protein
VRLNVNQDISDPFDFRLDAIAHLMCDFVRLADSQVRVDFQV